LAAIQSSQTYLPSRSKLATELVGQVLVRILKSREKEYATTLEEDEKLLQDGSLSSRTAMAVQVRLGEKKVLRGAIHEAAMFAGSNKRMRNGKTGSEWKRKAEDSSNPKKRGRFI
jgi:N-lysine methyltransferase SETD6